MNRGDLKSRRRDPFSATLTEGTARTLSRRLESTVYIWTGSKSRRTLVPETVEPAIR